MTAKITCIDKAGNERQKLFKGMIMKHNRGNAYFDTYYIYNEQQQIAGIIEDHCRQVKQQYFIGWKLDNPSHYTAGETAGKTKMFDTIEEAMIYSVGQVVTERI